MRYMMEQYCRNKGFLLAVFGLFFFLMLGCWWDLPAAVDCLYLLQISRELGVAALLRPVAAALPISFFLMHEWGTKYYQMVLPRMSGWKYACSKVWAAWLVGFLVPFLACLAMTGMILFLSPWRMNPLGLRTADALFPWLEHTHWLTKYGLYILDFSLAGSLWATVTVIVSTFTANAYVLIAIPFLLDRVFSYTMYRLAEHHAVWSWLDTARGTATQSREGVLVQLGFHLLMGVAACVTVHGAVKRRVQNG